jgi:hypothetical protein
LRTRCAIAIDTASHRVEQFFILEGLSSLEQTS